MKIIFLSGIPGAGKSTYAKALRNPETLYINKDSIREMFFGGKYTHGGVKFVEHAINRHILSEFVEAIIKGDGGRTEEDGDPIINTIVLDNTNCVFKKLYKDIENIRDINTTSAVEIEIMIFQVPIDTCYARVQQRTETMELSVLEGFEKAQIDLLSKINEITDTFNVGVKYV